jgi:flagellar M-ring protein FliF
MDVLPRITRQFADRFREMPPVQRVASIVLLFIVCAGFGWLVVFNQRTDFQPVSFGKSFDNEELASAERALVAAGLTNFRRDGQRLLSPAKDLPRYNAALMEFDALPGDLGTQMIKQFETLGPFSTDRQRQQMKEALLLQELRRMIKAVPDLEDARVVIASPERRSGWNQKTRVTANVSVKPRPGREVSATLANSLRHVVASVVPDLLPVDVTIFDVTRGQTFTGEPTDTSLETRQRQQTHEITEQYEQRLQKALSHIPGVGVVVHIDLERRSPSTFRRTALQTRDDHARVFNRPVSLDGAVAHVTGFRRTGDDPSDVSNTGLESKSAHVADLPQNIRVSVSIPRDYLRDVARRMQHASTDPIDLEFVEQDVSAKVERIVAGLIPSDLARQIVSVTCVDRLSTEPQNENRRSISFPITSFIQKWRGAVAIAGLMTLAGFWILKRKSRSLSGSNQLPSFHEREPTSVASPPLLEMTTAMTASKLDHFAMLRDEIRSLVESDSAAAAVLLGNWLSESNE